MSETTQPDFTDIRIEPARVVVGDFLDQPDAFRSWEKDLGIAEATRPVLAALRLIQAELPTEPDAAIGYRQGAALGCRLLQVATGAAPFPDPAQCDRYAQRMVAVSRSNPDRPRLDGFSVVWKRLAAVSPAFANVIGEIADTYFPERPYFTVGAYDAWSLLSGREPSRSEKSATVEK